MNSSEIAAIIVSIACPIASVLIALITLRSKKKKEDQEEGHKEGALFTEVGYIKSATDRIERRLDKLDEYQAEQSKVIATLEAKLDAHLKDRNAHNYKGD